MKCHEQPLVKGESSRIWRADDLGDLELLDARYISYSFARHTHEGAAVGVIEEGVESFTYQGATHIAPAGQIVVFNPNEAHTGQGADERGWRFRMFYLDARLLQRAVSEMTGQSKDIPFFSTPTLHDPGIAGILRDLHICLGSESSLLERQSKFLFTFAELAHRHADARPVAKALTRERATVRRVQNYLIEHSSQNVSLDELARILPGMGVVSEVISTFSRKRVFGYTAVAFSSVAIAVFGFFVWEHHMFIMGVSNYSAMVFSLLTMLVAVPTAIKVFNWSATLYKGSITFETPMLYTFGFLGLVTIGGLTGVFLGSMGMDIHLTETYFVVAHFHFVMVGGMPMAFLCGIHFWWPKMTGRMYPEGVSKLAAVVTFIGFILTFFPQFVLGYLGMPRRYAAYPPEFQTLNIFSTAGATVLGVGYMLPMLYLPWSLKYGKIAGANPWRATGLEWQIQSPPLTENFTETPLVDHEAYDYEWLEQASKPQLTTS